MEQPRRTEFTADEFIAWALEQATGRFELDNGAVVAMAPERIDHTRAKRNAYDRASQRDRSARLSLRASAGWRIGKSKRQGLSTNPMRWSDADLISPGVRWR